VTELRASIDELNAVLAESRFVEPFGFRVLSCAPGVCTLEIPFEPWLERPGGIVNGVVLMGASDVAMWLAIMTLRGTQEQWVTTDLATAFLRSGRRENLVCTANVLKLGRRTAYGTAECRSAGAALIAHHTVTYARLHEATSVG
jgi:uncharacterized protein (TIGR00369 family)